MAIDTPSTATAATPVAAPAPSPATAPAVAAPAATTTAPAAKKPHTAFKVSLEHFATKLSGTDKRVALIHGFVHTMKVAKKFRDFPANYHAAFAAYAGTPFKKRAAAHTATAATK
jgi:hypothetical protein